MTNRPEWFTLVDESNTVVGVVAHEVALLLISGGVVNPLDGGRTLRLLSKAHEHTGITATVPPARLVSVSFSVDDPTSAPSLATVIQKKFTGASADVEIEYLNSDDKVRLDRAFVGTNKSLHPQGSASDKAYTSLDAWLMAVHEVKQAGHSLACLSAPKERVAVVLDYDTDMTYSLPFRHLYATSHGVQPATVKAWGFEKDPLELLRQVRHGVQPATVKAWGFEKDPLELLRQVRDHNLRECLVAGKADPLNEGVLDAQPDAELEALFMGDAVEVLAAFHDHTESMKNQPGFSRSPDAP